MKRVLLKLSGEALGDSAGKGFSEEKVIEVAEQVCTVAKEGLQLGIVIGGGNFWRGRASSKKIPREKSDQIGMLGTVMNCVFMAEICRTLGRDADVYTPFKCSSFTKEYRMEDVEESFAKGKLVFFAGGSGHPYFSTDTATALRAIQIHADVILLAKAVDGVYDSDPKVNPNAVRYDEIAIEKVVEDHLQAMDLTASVMCMENKIPMLVFALERENSIVRTVHGDFEGTKIIV